MDHDNENVPDVVEADNINVEDCNDHIQIDLQSVEHFVDSVLDEAVCEVESASQITNDEQLGLQTEHLVNVVHDVAVCEVESASKVTEDEQLGFQADSELSAGELTDQLVDVEKSHDDVSVEKTWSMDIRSMADQFTVDKKITSEGKTNKEQIDENNCFACKTRVYPMERFVADKRLYHKTCFKCSKCKRTLGVDFAVNNGELYCKPHFLESFKMRGRYDDVVPGVQKPAESLQQEDGTMEEAKEDLPPLAVTKNMLAKFRAMQTNDKQPPANKITAKPKTNGATKERVHDQKDQKESAELVRSQDASVIVQEELPPPDTTRCMTAKWKAMEKSAAPAPVHKATQQRKTGTTPVYRLPTAIASAEVYGKKSDVQLIEQNGNHSALDATTENVPESPDDDVVRNAFGEIREGEMPEAGTTRSLLSLFQKSQ